MIILKQENINIINQPQAPTARHRFPICCGICRIMGKMSLVLNRTWKLGYDPPEFRGRGEPRIT